MTCLNPLYNCYKRKQKSSRYYGWKWAVSVGTVTGICVLALNVALLAIAMRKAKDNGIVTLFTNKE